MHPLYLTNSINIMTNKYAIKQQLFVETIKRINK